MPLKRKSEVKLCDSCGEKDENKFSEYIYNICKECKLEKSSKNYLCKYCGISDESLFYKGRYGNCKKCYNSKKQEGPQFKKYIEESSNSKKLNESEESDVKKIFMSNDIDVRKIVKQIIKSDVGIMDFGYTIKQSIDEIKSENLSLNDKILKLEDENKFLRCEIFKILSSINEYQNDINRFKLESLKF